MFSLDNIDSSVVSSGDPQAFKGNSASPLMLEGPPVLLSSFQGMNVNCFADNDNRIEPSVDEAAGHRGKLDYDMNGANCCKALNTC